MKHGVVGALCAVAVAGAALAQTPNKAAAKPGSRTAQAPAAMAKDAATLEFEKFRAEMEDSNPAELFEARGEAFWKSPTVRRTPRSTKAVTWARAWARSRAPM